MPMQPGLEEISTGFESESRVRRKRAAVRSRLVPLCEGYCTRSPPCPSADWYRILLEKAFEEGSVLIYL